MTFRPALAAFALAATACQESPVAPASPPAGLPVSLAILDGATSSPEPRASITADRDSVVFNATIPSPSCFDVVTSAGVSAGSLVVTITKRVAEPERFCALVATTAAVRAVVRSAPSGRYTAVLRQRFESPTQGAQEREVLRGVVVVP